MTIAWIGQSPPVYEFPPVDPFARVEPAAPARETQAAGGVRAEKEVRPGAAAYAQAGGGSPSAETRKPAVLASQIMTSPVVTLTLAATVAEAREIIRRRRFRHIPVVTDDGRLVGMVSDRYLLAGPPHPDRPDEPQDPPRPDQTVGEVMTPRVLCAAPDTSIREIARILVEERVGALPILDHRVRPVGILTITDVLKCVVHTAPLDLWM